MVMDKRKSNAFTTPNLKCLLVLEQKKKEESRRRRNEGKGNGFCFRPRRGEVVCMLCEDEGVKEGIYRSGEGMRVRSCVGFYEGWM